MGWYIPAKGTRVPPQEEVQDGNNGEIYRDLVMEDEFWAKEYMVRSVFASFFRNWHRSRNNSINKVR